MFFLLLLFWIIFNGNLTVEILVIGCIISAVVCLFMSRFMDYSFRTELRAVRLAPGFLAYLGILIVEIIKANFSVLSFILHKPERVEPTFISFNCPLKSKLARTILANSITLTPGTITVSLKNDEFTVHCLDRSLAEGLDESVFVKKLIKLESEFYKEGGKK